MPSDSEGRMNTRQQHQVGALAPTSTGLFRINNPKLINFPPWRKKRQPSSGSPVLAKYLVFPSEPLQFNIQVGTTGRLKTAFRMFTALANPTAQGGKSDPKVGGDFALAAAAGLHRPNRLNVEIP